MFDLSGLTHAPDGHDAVVNLASAMPSTEASAHSFTVAGRTGVILRLGFFYGPGARHSEQFLAMARLGVVPVLGHPDGYLSSIHVGDGGRAVAAVLSAMTGVYNVVDNEPSTKRQCASAFAQAAGRRTWMRAPGRGAHLLGYRTTSLTRSIRVGNQKLKSATRRTPGFPKAREGWRATSRSRVGPMTPT